MSTELNVIEKIRESIKQPVLGAKLVQCTGNVLEDDPTYIEVLINNKSVFAKPSFPLGWSHIPTADWLEKNKDKVGFYVIFENNNLAHPIWLGMTVLDNQSEHIDNYTDSVNIKTTNFEFTFDNKSDYFRVFRLEGDSVNQEIHFGEDGSISIKNKDNSSLIISGDTVSITSKEQNKLVANSSITLGKGTDKAVLGSVLINILTQLITAISTMTVTCGPPTSPSSPPINIAQFQALQSQLNTILSQTIKIE